MRSNAMRTARSWWSIASMKTVGASSRPSSPSRRSRRRAMRPLFPNWERRSFSTRRFCAGFWTRLSGGSLRLDIERARQLDAYQEALLVIDELDVAAMAHDDIAGDGEAEAGAAGLAVARFLQPLEGREGPLDLIGPD